MTDTEQKEIWKIYPEFPFIEVSNLGRVRTVDHYVPGKNGSKRLIKGHVLKQYPNENGYMDVPFNVNGKTVHRRTSRLVAICFIPNPNNYPEVNHIDCDPTNNRWDNLEWCTSQYNSAYRDKLGHWVNNNPGHPVIAVNLDTLEVMHFESQCEAARQLGACQGSISAVINGKLNKTHSFWFCYADDNAVEKTRAKFGNKVAHEVEKLIGENYD